MDSPRLSARPRSATVMERCRGETTGERCETTTSRGMNRNPRPVGLGRCQDDDVLERFETDRFVLRLMILEDLDLLVELDSDPEVMRYLTGKPSTRDEVAAIMSKLLGTRLDCLRQVDRCLRWMVRARARI